MYAIRTARASLNQILASGAGLIMLAPIYLVFANALKNQTDSATMSMELPLNPQWGNFGTVIDQGKLVEAFFNSVLYSVGGTVLSVLRFRLRRIRAGSPSPADGTRSSTCS